MSRECGLREERDRSCSWLFHSHVDFFSFYLHYINLAPPSNCNTFPPLRHQRREHRVVLELRSNGGLTCNSNRAENGQNKRYREEQDREVASKVAKDTHLAKQKLTERVQYII